MTARELTIVVGIGLVLVSRTVLGSWINPVSLFILPFLAPLTGQSLFFPELPFGTKAGLVVSGGFTGYSLGVFLVAGRITVSDAHALTNRIQPRGSERWFDHFAIALAAIPWITASFAWYLTRILGWGQLSSGQVFKEAFAEALQGSLLGWVYRALQLAMYLAALLLAMGVLSGRRAPRSAAIVFVLGVLAVALVTVTRLRILMVLFTFGAMWFVGSTHRWRVIDLRILGRLFGTVAGMIALAATILLVRYRAFDEFGMWFIERISLHLVGAPSGLSRWLDIHRGTEAFTGEVLKGVLELAGIQSREIGAYDQVLLLSHDLNIVTNLFTGFRFFVMDFGVFGAIAALALGGCVAGYLYRSAILGGSVQSVSLLACVYLWSLWFPITTLSYYNFWVFMCLVSLVTPLFFTARPPSLTREPASTAPDLPSGAT